MVTEEESGPGPADPTDPAGSVVARGPPRAGNAAAAPAPQTRLRAHLIEANTSPDVSHSTPVTAALVPAATEDLFRLVLDEVTF